MHRPTRQHKVLSEKLEVKRKRSRLPGKKAKRMGKWATLYQPRVEGQVQEQEAQS